MRLPHDNDLTLPEENDLVVDAADLVALTDADVLAMLPAWVRKAPSALRDGIVRASRRFWLRVQARVGFVLGSQQTPRNAAGLRLDAHGDRRHRTRARGEGDPGYRARLLDRPDTITPNAIRAALVALVLADTPVPPVAFEPATEGVFAQTEATQGNWIAFAQLRDGPLLWAEYLDNPIRAGVWVGPEADVTRPVFVVLVEGPLYELVDQPFGLPVGATAPELDAVFAGVETGPVAWGYAGVETPPLVNRIVRELEARRGFGVVWRLLVIPDLRGAL